MFGGVKIVVGEVLAEVDIAGGRKAGVPTSEETVGAVGGRRTD